LRTMARSTSVSLVLGAVLAIVVVMSSADPGYLLSCVGDCQATGYPPQPTAPGLAMMGSQSNPIQSTPLHSLATAVDPCSSISQ